MTYTIEVNNVTKQFRNYTAVDHINLKFEKGKISALLGPNGAGKTTTISMILGLMKPTSGDITVLGQPAGTKALSQRVGALMQDVKAADGLTVVEVLNLFRSYYTNPMSLEQLLDISGLHKEAKRRASALSGGQRRRLAFAQSLVGNPELILLDEPTVGMDVEARTRFWDTIKGLAANGRSILLTTHDLYEADAVADHISIIAGGRIVAEGTPQELKRHSALRTVSFHAARPPHENELLKLPGVEKVEMVQSRICLHVEQTDELLALLLQQDWGVTDIEVHAAKFEDAFRALTK
ncbi:ABC transporter ATP-binding protein [Paenibacillus albiflavus]|uniref:ABC transporter ATP-binding protein n=1 Tax=Paenibacillus albiflavus TaxID=2545760 RepID=A0A4R4EJ69_9BACL|nr:ABC transporter ATP-binding protein [Paenibacillus albiflavus]TCZ78275.1 ABC transporter ATP-binding protein [Paenibacillus albiflavus]